MEGDKKQSKINIGQIASVLGLIITIIGGIFYFGSFAHSGLIQQVSIFWGSSLWLLIFVEVLKSLERTFPRTKKEGIMSSHSQATIPIEGRITEFWDKPIPEKLYYKGIIYEREKDKCIQQNQKLQILLENDIEDTRIDYKEIYTIYEKIKEFSAHAIHTTDALIDTLPDTISIMSEFSDKDVFYSYLDYLQYEMNWLQKMSREMQGAIERWIVYHHIEAKGEKEKLIHILTKGDNKISESMNILLTATNTLRASGDEQITKDILVRQRI